LIDVAGDGGQAEIGDAHVALSVDHDVGRFEIAMEHAALVRRRQARAELAGQVQRLVFRKAADAPQQRRQILAVHVLHRQKRKARGVADVVHPADVLVRDLAGEAHLVVELRQAEGVVFKRRRQEFERDRLAQRQVVRTIHLAHTALSEAGDDAIAISEEGSRLESSVRS
jgi:hypothetical protein